MATLTGTLGNDRLAGTLDDDRLSGRRGADILTGRAGNDVLRGGSGDDRLDGGVGNDRLFGQGGADVLLGGAGADRLNGHGGADVLTGGSGADRFQFSALGPVDVVTDFSFDQGDTIEMTGALTGAAVRLAGAGLNTSVLVSTTSADTFTEVAVLQNVQQPIDVWYGDTQAFGAPGEAQRWVNVLGNVSTQGLTTFTYSLNGGPEQALATGPNNTRLPRPGDFNIELDYAQLDPTAADDVVTIEAQYANGLTFTRDVTIQYLDSPAPWSTDYTIDWSEVRDIQDVVQVVDGLWSFDASGARPAIPGYDRVITMGDQTWDSYEVRLSIEMNSLDTVAPGRRAAIWLGMQWGGHTDDPEGGSPHVGWVPGTTFMLSREQGVILRPSEFFDRDVTGDGIIDRQAVQADQVLLDGLTYEIRIRNERDLSDTDPSDGFDRTYSIRIWEAGTPEPDTWLITNTMINQEPFGGFYLNAHHLDVTFGDVEVRELRPEDLLQTEDGLDPEVATGAQPTAAGSDPAPEAGALLTADALLTPADDMTMMSNV